MREGINDFVAVRWSCTVRAGAGRRTATAGRTKARNGQKEDRNGSDRFDVGANIHEPHFAGRERKTQVVRAQTLVTRRR